MSDFSVTIENDSRGAVVRAAGKLDFDAIPRFEQTSAQLASAGAKRVVLDASQLKYLNSAGIGVLIKLHRQLRERGGDLRLATASADVQRTLKVCFLDQVLKSFTTVEEALAG